MARRRAGPQARSSTPAPATVPRPGGDRDPAARRRRGAGGAAGAAQRRGALHGRRMGVSRRRRRRHEGDGDAAHRRAAIRELPRRPRSSSTTPTRSSSSRAGSRPRAGEDPLRHPLLPRPAARRRSERAIDGEECVDRGWFTPAAALEAYAAASIQLVFPTIKHLEQLRGFASVRRAARVRARARGAAGRAAGPARRRGRPACCCRASPRVIECPLCWRDSARWRGAGGSLDR